MWCWILIAVAVSQRSRRVERCELAFALATLSAAVEVVCELKDWIAPVELQWGVQLGTKHESNYIHGHKYNYSRSILNMYSSMYNYSNNKCYNDSEVEYGTLCDQFNLLEEV
jgi:hypothetical protein